MDKARLYLIFIEGQVKPGWEDWFGGLSQQGLGGCTLLFGLLPDQSALLGVLDAVHNLGLTVISLHSLETETSLPEVTELQKGASK
jgi:hypothetical protein